MLHSLNELRDILKGQLYTQAGRVQLLNQFVRVAILLLTLLGVELAFLPKLYVKFLKDRVEALLVRADLLRVKQIE